MKCRVIFSLVIILCVSKFVLETRASNILFFHLTATASHRTGIWPLATKLADSGHNVTYVFPLTKRPGSHPKIEEITPSKLTKDMEHFLGDFDINIRLNNSIDQYNLQAFLKTTSFCEALYDSEEIQEWLAKPGLSYDLVLLDGGFSQCAYPLIYKFKAKHILFSPITIPFYWDSFGVVPETSSIPEVIYHQDTANLLTSLWSRTMNTLAVMVSRLAFLYTMSNLESSVREKLNLTDMPSFEEIEEQTSLVLQNSYFIEDYPMSLPPMFVSYSGMSCTEKSRKERKPLPKELETFVGGSEGFVYVSLGSAVKASAMPADLRNEFFAAFAAFPNLKFLWRWTGPIPDNTPKNVYLDTWFPQLDILAHPKIKAFVTQAGRPSAQEALCYAIPMVSIPIFADQQFGSERLESIGAAVPLDITTLKAEQLVAALKEVIYTNKYKDRVTELSTMFRDRSMDPVEYVYYWVEYVLRHNTNLLKPLAMKQTWYQRRLLDAYAFLSVIVLSLSALITFVCYQVTKAILRKTGLIKGWSSHKRKID